MGRLIDADDLLEKSIYEFYQDCSALTPDGSYILKKFRRLVKEAPLVQPERMDLIERHAAIDTEGLEEEIRCEMCKNPMHTDRGCDGHCKYDEILYEKIIQILDKRITQLPSAQSEIVRCKDCKHHHRDNNGAYYCGIKDYGYGWGIE